MKIMNPYWKVHFVLQIVKRSKIFNISWNIIQMGWLQHVDVAARRNEQNANKFNETSMKWSEIRTSKVYRISVQFLSFLMSNYYIIYRNVYVVLISSDWKRAYSINYPVWKEHERKNNLKFGRTKQVIIMKIKQNKTLLQSMRFFCCNF